MQSSKRIRVYVAGAAGRMGRETVRTVMKAPDMELVGGATSQSGIGDDLGAVIGLETVGIFLDTDLAAGLARTRPDVMVDFTVPEAAAGNALTALAAGVRPVVGTTGITPDDLARIGQVAQEKGVGALVAPNFALGALLLMRFAQETARHFDQVEIIEMHHEKKLDAPSGTAVKTAQLMAEARAAFNQGRPAETAFLPGSRGAIGEGNIPIHSIRLPGFLASQEVLFGGQGQTLTIRHDTVDRSAFMPGVLLGIRQILSRTGLVYGLEHLL